MPGVEINVTFYMTKTYRRPHFSGSIYQAKQKLIGTEGTRLLREMRVSRGGSRTARGKRVPEVKTNVHISQARLLSVSTD